MTAHTKWGLTALMAVWVGFAAGPAMAQDDAADKPAPAPTVATGPIIGSAPGYGQSVKFKRHPEHHKDFKAYSPYRDHRFGYYPGPHTGGGCPHCQGHGGYHGAYGHHGQYACPHCYGYGCKYCQSGHGLPQHYTTYEYDWPQNLVYPQQSAPSAMIQWPYYTLRGPTDFFME